MIANRFVDIIRFHGVVSLITISEDRCISNETERTGSCGETGQGLATIWSVYKVVTVFLLV